MAFFVHLIRNFNLTLAVLVSSIGVLLAHLFAYFLDPQRIRTYPGPFLAKLSDTWLGWVTMDGHRSEVVHNLHLKYGPFVRLAPNHISIADPDALATVYAHANGILKSPFYDTFVSFRRATIFSTRNRDEHARKRKMVAHIFSPRSIIEFEPQIRTYVAELLSRWDRLYDSAIKGLSGAEGESGWRGGDGRLWFDCLPWLHYLAFDIVGDLSFGTPFGMIEAAKDVALAPKRPDDVINSYGSDMKDVETEEIPAIQVLIKRGEYAMVMGILPAWWRPVIQQLPWFRLGTITTKHLAGIAIMAVARRLAISTDRVDILSKLLAGKDGNGNPMNRQELTSEALSYIVAGSDTTSNSSAAIIYHLARNPYIQDKLHKELDEQLSTEDEITATCDQVKRLPYMDACINEGLRVHSTVSIGLPRVVPEGGLTVLGQFFPEGTVLSVPIYSIHHDVAIWGEDADIYRPERWFEIDTATAQKSFVPFSIGPRACVGRNLAFLELQIIIASIMHKYHIVLESPDEPFQTREGFIRKPVACKVGLKRRDL